MTGAPAAVLRKSSAGHGAAGGEHDAERTPGSSAAGPPAGRRGSAASGNERWGSRPRKLLSSGLLSSLPESSSCTVSDPRGKPKFREGGRRALNRQAAETAKAREPRNERQPQDRRVVARDGLEQVDAETLHLVGPGAAQGRLASRGARSPLCLRNAW